MSAPPGSTPQGTVGLDEKHAAVPGTFLDRHPVAIEFVVFVVTTFAGTEISKVVHELDGRDPLHHLETEFVLAAQPQRRPMQHAERRPVHFVSENAQ